MALHTFTYRVADGELHSFRCLAASAEQAVRFWAEERDLVRKVTGGPVFPVSVEVAR